MARRLRKLRLGPALLALAAAVGGCSRDEPAEAPSPAPDAARPSREGPATARWDVVDTLRAGIDLAHDPSDGGGSARLVRGPDQPPHTTRGTSDRFRIVYETGPLGIAVGGSIQLQVSPFWGWSTPQVAQPDAPGYTTVSTDAEGVTLAPETLDQQLLGIEVGGRALAAGERVEIVYGAGPAGAHTDRYAERDSAFWIAVDGDGDGTRRFLPDPPAIDVRAGPPAELALRVPTVARPGETVRVVLAVLDAAANTGVACEGEAEFVDPPEGLVLPERVPFGASDAGRRAVEARVVEPGVYRLEATLACDGGPPLAAYANPMVASAEGPRVLWGDLHGHSNFSDGTGVPEDYFVYARDVSALDVVALTDHDHWGIRPLVDAPELWSEIRAQTQRFHDPGRFVTLLGFEWTSWIHGHRHVLFSGDQGALVDSVAPGSDAPGDLWDALARWTARTGASALTIAHHPAGGPVAVDWSVAPDPRFEPVVEIVSVHGSSEAADTPGPIYDAIDGHWVRDALDRGFRLGFVGSGDRHDGHPGDYRVDAAEGGLAAIVADELTRDAVLDALRERRVYATNGARILLRTALGGHGMGATLPRAPGEARSERLFVHVVGETGLESVELVRSGALADGVLLDGRLEAQLEREIPDLAAGEYVYVRVLQRDGGAAWSSPIWIGEPPAADSAADPPLDEVGEAALDDSEEVEAGPADGGDRGGAGR